MTAMEQIQSTDIYQINRNLDHGFHRTEIPSPHMALCNSDFFRTKRNQCLTKNQTDINGETIKGIVIFDIDIPIEKFQIRSLSPPPVSLVMNENNSSTKIEAIPNNQQRPCLSTTYSGYQRTKTRSLQLKSLDENYSFPKKFVHFADDFGLELSRTKLINTDELPCVPREAFKHLQIDNDPDLLNPECVKIITYMEPQFENPIHMQGFNDLVSRNRIVLEQANAIDNRIYGTIRLISLGLQKRVKIRFTTDNWISFHDHDALYINNSYDGIYDRFSFTLEIDRDRICIGNTIQFSICYESFGGQEYWDNNYQQNYRFNCFSRTIPDYSI